MRRHTRALMAVIAAVTTSTGTSMASTKDADGTAMDPIGTAVSAAIRTAIADGRLAVFAEGEHAADAWGDICVGTTGIDDGGAARINQEYLVWNRRYFYPASTIKLYAAIAAYEQMNALSRMYPEAELSERTALRFHPLFDGDAVRETDPSRDRSTDVFGEPQITIEHEAHKLFVVSDNDAFNTLYDFVGHRDLNTRLWSWGVQSSRIDHRLSVSRTADENRRAPRVDLGLPPGSPQVGERFSTLAEAGPDPVWLGERAGLKLGTGFIRTGELVEEPFDFAGKNFTTLADLQRVLAGLLMPALGAPGDGRPFDLTDAQRASLIASATMLPRESESPKYDPAEYPDDHVKFLLPGLLKVRPLDEWRVVNKIGLAYGFVTENAFVEHRPTGNCIFVAAVIHRNPNGIYNDNQYDYETTLAEMAMLGEVVGRALVKGVP